LNLTQVSPYTLTWPRLLVRTSHYVRIQTSLHESHHWKSLAENLQGKYPRRWKENGRILHRIHSLHQKAKQITEDFAKKVWVVGAKRMGASIIKLESLKNLIRNVGKLAKEFRDKLYLMQYRRLQYWIGWQTKKHVVEFVNPKYSSFT